MKKLLFLFSITLLTCSAFANDTTRVSVQVGAQKSGTIYIRDQVTGVFLSGVISNIVIQNYNPTIATVELGSAVNSVKVNGVAAGSGSAIVSCQVTYTDPGDGLQKTETKSIVVSYTVTNQVASSPHGVKLALAFN